MTVWLGGRVTGSSYTRSPRPRTRRTVEDRRTFFRGKIMEQLETRSAVASHPELDDIVGCLAGADRQTGFGRTSAAGPPCCAGRSTACSKSPAEWVRAGCAAKGIDPASPLAGEEWFGGPMTTVRGLRLLAEALESRRRSQRRCAGARVKAGRWSPTSSPRRCASDLMYSRMTVEVWIEPGQAADARPHLPGEGRGCAPHRRCLPRARRRQRRVDRSAGRALQALRRGRGRRPEDEPGERVPGAAFSRRAFSSLDRRRAIWRSSTAAPTSASYLCASSADRRRST